MLEIFQGEDQSATIDLESKKTGKPFDLTGATEIEVCFIGGTTIIKRLLSLSEVSVVGSPLNRQISTSLTAAQTATLVVTQAGNIQVRITQPGGVSMVQILNAFAVKADLCP